MALIHSCYQLSQKAREIYNSFLSNKATTPVNIDSQAQLADDVLTAPRPDMFKQPQLQVSFHMYMYTHANLRELKSLYQTKKWTLLWNLSFFISVSVDL